MIIEQLTESLNTKKDELSQRIDTLRNAPDHEEELNKVLRDLAQVEEALALIA